jgi:hypothetical protein
VKEESVANEQSAQSRQRINKLLKDIRTKDYSIGDPNRVETAKSIFAGKLIELGGRRADIEALVQLARTAGRGTEEALGLATLIAEVASHHPDLAVKLWEDHHTKICTGSVAKAVAYWGLWLAHAQRPGKLIRAQQFRAAAGDVEDLLTDHEREAYHDLATIPKEPASMPIGSFAIPASESRGKDLSGWLHNNRSLTIGSFGSHFGDFATNDKHFVATAESSAQLAAMQVRQGLSKPANYLLQATPGSGKSHFVRQFAKRLLSADGFRDQYLERNLSAYSSIADAFQDIVLDVLLALAKHRPVLLFIDEVDTEIDGKHIFQKLIAPMNGDDFFFQGKLVSLAKQNLVVCHALSALPATLENKPKWPDFLSRIPSEHQFNLPSLEHPLERVFRALSSLIRHAERFSNYAGVSRISYQALLYLGLNAWASARELDQALEMGLLRLADPNAALELEHLVLDPSAVFQAEREQSIAIFGETDFHVEVRPRAKAAARP